MFFGPTQKLLQLSLAVCDEVFFDMSSWSSCKTSQQLGHVQGLKRCLASRCSPTDNEAIFPGFDSVTAREAVPGRHLKTAWHLASFWGFFDMSSWSSCKTSQQLGHVQGLKRCLASRCSPTDNEAIFPGFDSVMAREAFPGRHLKTAWHLASFWGPAIPCEALRNRQGKEAACESSDG